MAKALSPSDGHNTGVPEAAHGTPSAFLLTYLVVFLRSCWCQDTEPRGPLSLLGSQVLDADIKTGKKHCFEISNRRPLFFLYADLGR